MGNVSSAVGQLLLLAMIVPASRQATAQPAGADSARVADGLRVYIHNFSDFDDATLDAAARDTEQIFRQAGVELLVVNDPMAMRNGELRPVNNFAHTAADMVVNILTPQMAATLPVGPSVLGVAPGAGTKGRSMAHVFAHRVRELRVHRRDQERWTSLDSE